MSTRLGRKPQYAAHVKDGTYCFEPHNVTLSWYYFVDLITALEKEYKRLQKVYEDGDDLERSYLDAVKEKFFWYIKEEPTPIDWGGTMESFIRLQKDLDSERVLVYYRDILRGELYDNGLPKHITKFQQANILAELHRRTT
jgi:hypothetical protein